MSSCKYSVTAPSDTSSTRAATPPPVNSVNVSLNREICSQSASCTQLINLGVTKGHLFNAVNWATCLHRLAKLFPTEAKNHKSIILSFLSAAHEVLLSGLEGLKFQPQHLATLLWAMAKLNIVDHGFVGDLVKRSLSVAESLKAQDMANIAWSLAKMGVAHYGEMFAMICSRISDRSGIIKQFKPMEIASTTWAFGTIGVKGMGVERSRVSTVIDSLINECLARDLRDFSPQALANVLWAMAKLEYASEELFSVFGEHMISSYRLREFKPQELANVIWAMESVGLPHLRLYYEIASTKAINWGSFDPHALVTVSGCLVGIKSPCMDTFAQMLGARVLQMPTNGTGSVMSLSAQQSGILLSLLCSHMHSPVVASAVSILTNKLLSNDLIPGTAIDAHTVKGLVLTLVDSQSLIEQLGRCAIVNAEYGASGEMHSLFGALKGISEGMKSVPTYAKADLVKSLVALIVEGLVSPRLSPDSVSLDQLAALLQMAKPLGLVSEEMATAVGKYLTKLNILQTTCSVEPIVKILSVLVDTAGDAKSSSPRMNVCRLLGAACLEQLKLGKLPLPVIALLSSSANRLDFLNGTEKPDPVVTAIVTAIISDVALIRPIEYTNQPQSLADILFDTCEFVARHSETGLDKHAKALAKLCASIAHTYPKGPDYFNLNSQAKIVASFFVLGLDLTDLWKEWSSKSFLSQFLIAGPGGLQLLKENLESFPLFCKLAAAQITLGALPGAWIEASELTTEKDKKDPFSLEAALCLSVALGNVGAVDTQKDVIGFWVLPLMTSSTTSCSNNSAPIVETSHTDISTAHRFLSTLLASPQLQRSEPRLRSYSELLTKCMTPTDDPWFVPS